MDSFWQTLEVWITDNPIRNDSVWFSIIFICSALVHIIIKKTAIVLLVNGIRQFTQKTKTVLDDYLFQKVQFQPLALFVYAAGLHIMAAKMAHGTFIFKKAADILVILVITRFIHGILDGFASYTEHQPRLQAKPYRSYIQVFILLVYLAAIIIAGGVISGRSPLTLLSGIGAMTAVLLLVFRETILSFVASIQISSYDLVRKGDWISVPQYGTDGDVTEVALHTIKIQNWDKTISVVPTHDLIQSGFKNWRGMQETGGRRIKRSLFLDVNSVRFMDTKLREQVGKIRLLQPYFEKIDKNIHVCYDNTGNHLNNARLTNLGTFRMYIVYYLRSLPVLRHDLTFLVRQLESGPTGIPLEIYVFTATTQWDEYEAIQADIFDHLFAAAGEFDLRIFQYPCSAFIPTETP